MRQRTQNRSANTAANPAQREPGNQPDWVVKSPAPSSRKDGLERVGAAWDREDGGICLRLVGTQIVNRDLYLFPTAQEDQQ